MVKRIFVIFLFITNYSHANTITSPYDNVAVVTNTLSWPYSPVTYGTDSFQSGGADNADTLILNEVKENGLNFPDDFQFGVACAAYQYEGNRKAPKLPNNPYGTGWSVWDVFSKKGSWLNPNSNNIAEVAPTGLVTQPSGEFAIAGFEPDVYLADIERAKKLGIKTYRLSISWPRIFPHAGMENPDEQGIKYYTDVLEAITKAGLTPLITLYHWDLPAWLYNFGDPNVKDKDKTYGWLDMRDAKDNLALKEFQKYTAVAYQRFGKYTPYFSTFNEPLTFTNNAFVIGNHAPGRYGFELLQKKNPQLYGNDLNESVERVPYLQAINIIKAHDIAYKTIHYLYNKDRKAYSQKPLVSIVLNTDWAEPFRIECDENNKCHYNEKDIVASQKQMDFQLGWWLDPVMFGSWPTNMDPVYKQRISSKLARFDDASCLQDDGKPVACDDKNKLKLSDDIRRGGTLDMLAINHYTGYFVVDMNYAKNYFGDNPLQNKVPPNQYGGTPNTLARGWDSDQGVFTTQFRYYKYGDQGALPFESDQPKRAYVIGNAGAKPWLRQTWFVYRKLMQYINFFYLNDISGTRPSITKSGIPFSKLDIYLTENGTSIYQESQQPVKDKLMDKNRIQYLVGNLGALRQAKIEDRINIKLYTYWSIADNFEWSEGYDSRFGLLWIDYDNNFAREPKQSYHCYQSIIANKSSMRFSKKDCPVD